MEQINNSEVIQAKDALIKSYEILAKQISEYFNNTGTGSPEERRESVLVCFKNQFIKDQIAKILDCHAEFSELVLLSDTENKFDSQDIASVLNAAGFRFVSRIQQRLDQYLKYTLVIDTAGDVPEVRDNFTNMTTIIVNRIKSDHRVMKSACDQISKLNTNPVL